MWPSGAMTGRVIFAELLQIARFGKIAFVVLVETAHCPEAQREHFRNPTAIAAGIAALIILIATMLLVRQITKPLKAVAGTLTILAEGRTDVEVQYADRADEIGVIARTADETGPGDEQLLADRALRIKLAGDLGLTI